MFFKDIQEESSDIRVQTPFHYESTDDEDSKAEIQGANVEGEEMDKEKINEEEEVDELYRDVNVNLEGRNTEMTDAPHTIVQTTQVIEDTHMFQLPLLLRHLIPHLQQTPVPTPATVPSSSLQDLPNFGSLFRFDHRLKTLENDFSKFKQMNQFVTTVSLISGIVDMYLANKMNEAVKTDVQLQSNRLRDKAQAKNEDFINKLDDKIKIIIKEQFKEQVKAQTSHVVAANLSELELKKILIDKMERNKSIHRSDEHKNLYKALVDAYESDKLILDTYGDTISFKR
ncbi:hypothetical protein Tco_1171524, partial [Tanacetum coccineum]